MFQFYSQLVRLELANDHLIQLYYVLFNDLAKEEKDLLENIRQLIEIREKIKFELKNHISQIKRSFRTSAVKNVVLEYLPVFLKLDYIARNTFNNPDWEVCYNKEKRNLRLYYEILYNQNISPATVDMLLKQKRRLESLPQ